MQLSRRQIVSLAQRSFSILGRIGGDATTIRRSLRRLESSFQYPRSDRRRCNRLSRPGGPFLPPLSVSSVGSEAMQLIDLQGIRNTARPFSILGRIGGDATLRCAGEDRRL